jgi:hypothetical protein
MSKLHTPGSRRAFVGTALGAAFFPLQLLGTYGSGGNVIFRKVLMLGDSLSVGPFGQEMQHFLIERFGESRVYLLASCGSSPEHWLGSEPEFVAKCGYRVKTPRQYLLGEYEKGHRPAPFPTPKLEHILAKTHPDLILVQLGTNWFDLLEQAASPDRIEHLDGIVDRFATTLLAAYPRPQLIWITPPDSARFRKVQGVVTDILRRASRRLRFTCIDSSDLVEYIPGKSGGDGVHYASAAAEKWANGVKGCLLKML